MTEKDYSATPLASKLGIKPGASVVLAGAPDGFLESLDPLPPGVAVSTRARPRTDVALLFARRRSDLDRRFGSLVRAMQPAGGLWIAWPKRSVVATDLDFSTVQRTGLDAGLVDNKSCSIDEVWQAVRFVRRLEDRRDLTPRRDGETPRGRPRIPARRRAR